MAAFSDLTAGTWTVDTSHSELGFVARHLMVSKVRGKFTDFDGEVQVGASIADSTVTASVRLASVDTNGADRDTHLRSADFFDVEKYPLMTFTSTRVTDDALEGNLTIRDVTRPVVFDLEFNGVQLDPWGNTKAGFEAKTEISRKDWGLTWNAALEGGGVLVSDKIAITLDIELAKA